jgi:NAD(P)-dependent dehydrogenase (short-subunit alcohol dehydrogenase family)
MRFTNKVAVVTGAGQGIGEGYARALAAEGAAVVVAELAEEQGRRVAREIGDAGGRALFVHTDVSDEASTRALGETTIAEFGGVDVLINNAAIYGNMELHGLMGVPWDYYKKFMAVNMDGCVLVTRALAGSMAERGGGAIVNQSSTAAWMGAGYYGIAKLAMHGITQSFARELGPRNIRVNAIAPGPTDTEATRKVVPDMFRDQILSSMPLSRMGEVSDMVNACLFLLSDDAAWITGQVLAVDGGQIMRT